MGVSPSRPRPPPPGGKKGGIPAIAWLGYFACGVGEGGGEKRGGRDGEGFWKLRVWEKEVLVGFLGGGGGLDGG